MQPQPIIEPLRIGDSVAERYRIVKRITSGGHSVVYRGEDMRLSRPVCVKVFHRLNASSDGIYQTAYEHSVQEAFALSKLTHPNTLRIYDFGYLADGDSTGRGPPYQVSEFMNHGTLSTMIKRRGPLPRPDAVKVISEIGGALGEAHQCGIIHRDIKPQNILFGKVGRGWVAKLADFGIAKSLGMADAMLENQAEDTAIVAGRPLLMYSLRWAAPEQLSGQPVVAGSDIYSLALSMLYMLTGNTVFVAQVKSEAREQRWRSDELIDAACAGHDIAPLAIAELKRACAFDPRERPGDAEEFTSALVEALGDRPVRSSSLRLQALASDGQPTTEFRPGNSLLRRLHPTHQGQSVADRRVDFVAAPAGKVDVSCGDGAVRLRLSFVPGERGFCLHIKGLDCFVARAGGRPSSAVLFQEDGRCDLLTPDLRPIANILVSMGTPAAGHRIFTIATESVAIATEHWQQVAAIDFGAGGECLFVYLATVAAS